MYYHYDTGYKFDTVCPYCHDNRPKNISMIPIYNYDNKEVMYLNIPIYLQKKINKNAEDIPVNKSNKYYLSIFKDKDGFLEVKVIKIKWYKLLLDSIKSYLSVFKLRKYFNIN